MIARLRLLVLMARPAVMVLLALFAATGLAQAGGGNDPRLLLEAMVVVSGFLLFCVVVNDLADEAVDRVNLPGDRRRPLAAGLSTRRQLAVAGATAGIVSLAASTLLHGPAVVVVGTGLALGTAYSLPPLRIAGRGALASLLLPAGYVAVPYLVGILAVRPVGPDDLVLLAGLYVGFIGRILLKDFRDVRGDALFGKRTFLVRHGRRRTCAISAACWVAGSAALLGVRERRGVWANEPPAGRGERIARLRTLHGSRGGPPSRATRRPKSHTVRAGAGVRAGAVWAAAARAPREAAVVYPDPDPVPGALGQGTRGGEAGAARARRTGGSRPARRAGAGPGGGGGEGGGTCSSAEGCWVLP